MKARQDVKPDIRQPPFTDYRQPPVDYRHPPVADYRQPPTLDYRHPPLLDYRQLAPDTRQFTIPEYRMPPVQVRMELTHDSHQPYFQRGEGRKDECIKLLSYWFSYLVYSHQLNMIQILFLFFSRYFDIFIVLTPDYPFFFFFSIPQIRTINWLTNWYIST